MFLFFLTGVEDILVKDGANKQRRKIIQKSVTCGSKVHQIIPVSEDLEPFSFLEKKMLVLSFKKEFILNGLPDFRNILWSSFNWWIISKVY